VPRKPSSVFVIVEHPNATTATPGTPPTGLQAWRVELGDRDPADVARDTYTAHPIGTVVYVVEDTKTAAYRVELTLDEIDDPRLPDPDEPDDA
jgi:hypothetical protein